MIAKKVRASIDVPQVKPNQNNVSGTEQDTKIQCLRATIVVVMNPTRIGGKACFRLASDQVQIVTLGALDLVVTNGLVIVTRPLLAGKVWTAVMRVPPFRIAPVQHVSPWHQSVRILANQRVPARRPYCRSNVSV